MTEQAIKETREHLKMISDYMNEQDRLPADLLPAMKTLVFLDNLFYLISEDVIDIAPANWKI